MNVNEAQLSAEDMILNFKVSPCLRKHPHDWTRCFNIHPGEKARRRSLQQHTYSSMMCGDMLHSGSCARGDACPMAHGMFEYHMHPDKFRTKMCIRGKSCKRPFCFFAHSHTELRFPEPTSDAHREAICPTNRSNTAATTAERQARDGSTPVVIHAPPFMRATELPVMQSSIEEAAATAAAAASAQVDGMMQLSACNSSSSDHAVYAPAQLHHNQNSMLIATPAAACNACGPGAGSSCATGTIPGTAAVQNGSQHAGSGIPYIQATSCLQGGTFQSAWNTTAHQLGNLQYHFTESRRQAEASTVTQLVTVASQTQNMISHIAPGDMQLSALPAGVSVSALPAGSPHLSAVPAGMSPSASMVPVGGFAGAAAAAAGAIGSAFSAAVSQQVIRNNSSSGSITALNQYMLNPEVTMNGSTHPVVNSQLSSTGAAWVPTQAVAAAGISPQLSFDSLSISGDLPQAGTYSTACVAAAAQPPGGNTVQLVHVPQQSCSTNSAGTTLPLGLPNVAAACTPGPTAVQQWSGQAGTGIAGNAGPLQSPADQYVYYK